MNCQEFVDFLMSYLDGELDETVRAVFDAHLGGCGACRGYMDDYVKTIELGRTACRDAEGPVPEDAPPELVRAILEARRAGGG
jgi:anti-sigma factor RsiW